MSDDPWRDEFEERHAERFGEWHSAEDEAEGDAPSNNTAAVSFHEQLTSGSWPIRVPVTFEIYADGSRPHVHPLDPGQRRRNPHSHIITIVLEYDRAKVRELMLDHIRERRDANESGLIAMMPLAWVDRDCFVKTAAHHFADLLRDNDRPLRDDRYLFVFVQELHEGDGDLIGDFVAETIAADRAAGNRLRDVILDTIDDPQARDHLGWLAAAAITDRLQAL